MANESAADKRPMRVCDVCGKIDDHPRVQHMFGATGAPSVRADLMRSVALHDDMTDEERQAALDELADPRSALRHHDCCVESGCPEGTCGPVLELTGGRGKTGKDLLKVLQQNAERANQDHENKILTLVKNSEN